MRLMRQRLAARTFPDMRFRTDWMAGLRWSWRADLVLAMVCCALGQVEAAVSGSNPVWVLSAVLATLPVAWRQRAPLAATVVVAASWAIFHLWNGGTDEPFFFFAV